MPNAGTCALIVKCPCVVPSEQTKQRFPIQMVCSPPGPPPSPSFGGGLLFLSNPASVSADLRPVSVANHGPFCPRTTRARVESRAGNIRTDIGKYRQPCSYPYLPFCHETARTRGDAKHRKLAQTTRIYRVFSPRPDVEEEDRAESAVEYDVPLVDHKTHYLSYAGIELTVQPPKAPPTTFTCFGFTLGPGRGARVGVCINIMAWRLVVYQRSIPVLPLALT